MSTKHHLTLKGDQMKIGIVINSRITSSRIPRKALAMINGKPMIQHLVDRLKVTGLPIIIAVPTEEFMNYAFLSENEKVYIHRSIHSEDPLARMHEVALVHGLDYVVRVTHDKMFIDTDLINLVIKYYLDYDYVYFKRSMPGIGFELISAKALSKATVKFKNVEFIGYAIREITDNVKSLSKWNSEYGGIRLLVDYPKDISLMHVLFSQLGNNCSLDEVISYLTLSPRLKAINRLPKVTIYTCAYNAEKWIYQAIESVKKLKYINFEYIMIDDFSTDRTPEFMALATADDNRFRFIRNDKNLGLASSCNVALNEARGEYIIRLDADDMFTDDQSLSSLVLHAEHNDFEITYPDYIKSYHDGSASSRHDGSEEHHAGCALFNKNALNYLRFTDGLRGHDSLDIFTRARDLLKIGYLKHVIFEYRQHPKSLSKTNLEYRELIKQQIIEGSDAKA